MKLSVKGLALTSAIMWGGSIFIMGVLNLIWAGYGVAYLDMVRSIYPGYAATSGFGGVIVGTCYGLVDGFVGGAIFAWLYNALKGGGAPPTNA
jgi:hypothetical protein